MGGLFSFFVLFTKALLWCSLCALTFQVLALWDRVIGFGSLEVLPVLAVAIFSFRHAALMNARTPDEAEAVFEDPSALKVAPLLQFCLFSSS